MSRDYNEGINEIFTTENLFEMGYDLKDLADANMLPKIMYDKLAYESRNRAQLSALLSTLSNFGSGRKEATVRWTAGDEEASTSANLATTTISFAMIASPGSGVVLNIDLHSLVPGNYVMIQEYSSGETYKAVLLITSKWATGGYTGSLVKTWTTSDATNVTFDFTVASQVTVINSTTDMDGRANTANTIIPVALENYMERIRESRVIGSHTNNGYFNFDSGINAQMKSKMQTFLERLNLTLALRTGFVAPELTAGTSPSKMKCFMDIACNEDRTAHDTYGGVSNGMAGRNCVLTSASTVDKDEIEEYMDRISQYGSEDRSKIMIGTPSFVRMVWRAFMTDNVAINTTSFRIPGYTKLWKGVTIETMAGNLHMVSDYSLANTKIYVEDNSEGSTAQANTANWGLVIDPKFVKLVYRDVPGDPDRPGVQSPKIVDVDSYGNDSRVTKEISAELTLIVKRPELIGYLII